MLTGVKVVIKHIKNKNCLLIFNNNMNEPQKLQTFGVHSCFCKHQIYLVL